MSDESTSIDTAEAGAAVSDSAVPEPAVVTELPTDAPRDGTGAESGSGEPDAGVEDEGDSFPRSYVERLRSESAGYRSRAKDAETARDDLQGRVQALEQVAVIRAGREAGLRAEADDDLLGLVELDDLRDEHGHLDPERLRAAVSDAERAKPFLFHRWPAVPHGVQAPPPSSRDPFVDVLRNAGAHNRRHP